jgi:hypothetical protein
VDKLFGPQSLRQYIFFLADAFIPRSVARIPYQLCLEAISLSSPLKISYWCRNSINEGNFVFGLSDLDITAVSPTRFTQTEFNQLFEHTKNIKKI